MISIASVAGITACGLLLAALYSDRKQYVGGRKRAAASRRSSHASQRTYIVMATRDVIDWPKYAGYLRDWREVSIHTKPKYVDFILYLDQSSRALWDVRATLKSRTDSTELTDKVKFHEHMARICPEAVAPTFEVTAESTLPLGGVVMVRANWGWKGAANAVAVNTTELQTLRECFSHGAKIHHKHSPREIVPRVIASEYIQDPLLWRGYKFHVRVHIVALFPGNSDWSESSRDADQLEPRVAQHVPLQAAITKTIEIIPAAKPYVNGDYSNADIHDTHDLRNATHGYLHELEDGPRLTQNIVDILRKAVVPMLSLVKTYPEARYSYDIFGADIMFRQDGTPVILEVNFRPGMNEDAPRMFINNEVVDAVFAVAFGPVFGGEYPADIIWL
jgi:hypothetical protein